MSTIKDVANYANVSIATVSKYLNGGNVLEENKKHIEEAIKVLDYKLNVMARGLKTQKTLTIGVLIPSLENIFFTTIVSYIEDVLLKNGYGTIICDYRESEKLEQQKLAFLDSKSVDGIIMVASFITADKIKEITGDTPLVLLDRMVDGMNCDAILTNNTNASYNAVEHLIQNNHRKIGIICGPKDVYTTNERYQGYTRVFEDYQIPLNENYILFGDYSIKCGHKALTKLWKMDEKPTAVYVTNYEMTIGVIMAINELNIKVPEELSIIGFDNIHLAEVFKPSITMIMQPMNEIAKTAANTMLQRLSGDYDNYPIISRLKTTLKINESTRSL
jgi:LacI family transcriptional regulator